MSVDLSVIIATHNQAERLKLVLCALAQQTFEGSWELLVVVDGCTDDTSALLAGADLDQLRVIGLRPNQGRNRARNWGIKAAQGELVVFLDGDALPAPDLLQRHWEAYCKAGGRAVLCGHQFCLSELEWFRDPQTGALGDWELPSVLADRLAANRRDLVVDEDLVRRDFAAIHERAVEGGYPHEDSRRRQAQVRQFLAARPNAASGWVGFVPHNGAIPAQLLAEGGAFDEEIPFFEGWELAYRLQRHCGAEVHAVAARSYHLYHHHDFSRPEEGDVRYRAVEHMVAAHHDERLRLLYFWIGALGDDPQLPGQAQVHDLFEFERRYRDLTADEWRDYQMVLDRHPHLAQYTEVCYEQYA